MDCGYILEDNVAYVYFIWEQYSFIPLRRVLQECSRVLSLPAIGKRNDDVTGVLSEYRVNR